MQQALTDLFEDLHTSADILVAGLVRRRIHDVAMLCKNGCPALGGGGHRLPSWTGISDGLAAQLVQSPVVDCAVGALEVWHLRA